MRIIYAHAAHTVKGMGNLACCAALKPIPQPRTAEAKAVGETIATWNTFAEKHGSFADEHSIGLSTRWMS